MKAITAYIKPHKLSEVTAVLKHMDGLTGMTILDCQGFGLGWGSSDEMPDDGLVDFRKSIKIEIVCLDHLSDQVVTAIEHSAHTGLKGDGKVYVGDISHAVRISTGESGDGAV